MKQFFTLLALTVAVLSSCTSAYKTGQTPDDVYYSPVRKAAEYVEVEQREEQPVQTNEDRFLRMRVEDRYRWSALDDYYFNNAYAYNSFGNYYSLSSPWNSYWAWNCHYNPYYGGIPYYPGGVIIIKNPKVYTPPSRALVFNPASYNVGGNSSSNLSKGLNNSYYNRYNNTNNNRNSRSTLGESIRKVFTNSDNSGSYNSGSNNSSPSRSYSPSSGGSSSGGGGRSGGGGGGVSRPSR